MYMSVLAIVLICSISIILLFIFYNLGKKLGSISAHRYWENQVNRLRKESNEKSRSIIKGQVAEQFAPFLPEFPFNPADCQFIGKPVDFIAFNCLDDPQQTAIVFIEIKTGKSRLNPHEKNLKHAIEAGRVFWYDYRLK